MYELGLGSLCPRHRIRSPRLRRVVALVHGMLGSDLRGKGEKEKAPETSVERRRCQGKRRKRCKDSLPENAMLMAESRRVMREKRGVRMSNGL